MSEQILPVLLITGVAGYVGHHILELVHSTYPSYTVYATHHSTNPWMKSPDDPLKQIHHIKLDLTSEQSIKDAIQHMFTKNIIPQIIIHCAAMPSLAVCQKNKDKAMKVNCCTVLVDTLLSYYASIKMKQHPLFIFLSTDHVYDGELSHVNTIPHECMRSAEHKMDVPKYDEQSPCYPINIYGQSKLKMEKHLLMHWRHLVILRPSVIYGPRNGIKSTLLQFVLDGLKNDDNEQLILFKNERRNFVSIWSVMQSVQHFINGYYTEHKQYHDVYNCGGTTSLTRVEFGAIAATVYGLDSKKIKAINRFDCKQQWAHSAPNPQDNSMSSDKLYREVKAHYTFPQQFADVIKQIKEHEDNVFVKLKT
eukprot:363935_1